MAPTADDAAQRACVEGGGLKRSLTAVESAVILERPFSQVLTLVIYGLLKKGAVSVTTPEPLRLAPLAHPEGLNHWSAADGTPISLHDYELAFMDAFRKHDFGRIEAMDLSVPFERLIRGTARRMGGFSLDLTRAYSRFRVDSAWRRVRQETGFEARCRNADENLDWLMLDDAWGGRLDELDLGHGTGRCGTTTAAPTAPAAIARGSLPSLPRTSFADVTNSSVDIGASAVVPSAAWTASSPRASTSAASTVSPATS